MPSDDLLSQVEAEPILRKMEAKIAELTRTIYVYEAQIEKLYNHINVLENNQKDKSPIWTKPGVKDEDPV